jgi:Type VI secretion system VasI, EvfG, VC_A0118
VRPGGPDSTSSAVLHVRCLEDRTRVLVQTPDRFSPANQPERLRVYDVPVRIRIDQLPVQAQTWRESDDATAISAPKAIALARQMAGKRRMRVEYVTHDRGARVVTFPIHGLEQRLGEVARACNWRC